MSFPKFERYGYDTGKSRYFRCSVCGYGISDLFEDGLILVYESGKSWSFCPNCGVHIVDDMSFDL